METILTIDFDVIMGPNINLYNNIINGEKDEMGNIEREIPLLRYANADLELYKKITEYLINIDKTTTEIIFINNHDEALNYINNPCYLINIDHHHDLGYNEHQGNDDQITCGNGVYKGLEKGKILNYIGIHGPNGEYSGLLEKNNIGDMNILQINLNTLVKPNKIIICASYPGIPITIRPLFELGKSMGKRS